MKPTMQSSVKLRSVIIKQDKKNYIVEDQEAREYYEMPPICIDAIQAIEESKSLERIEESLKQKYPQEDVQIVDFVQQLLEMDLIAELDGQEIYRQLTEDIKTHTNWIPEKAAKLFFNATSVKIYILLTLFNILVFLTQPQLLPHYRDMIVFDAMMFNILTWIFISFILLMIHEIGHLMAVRAQGLPARLGVGHRLFIVVLETEMTDVWSLPSRKRNLPFLAGICFDQTLLFAALIVQGLFPQATPLLLAIMGVVVIKLFLMMVYQFMFFMKTDIYHVVENVTGCYNLMENSNAWLRRKLPYLSMNDKPSEIFTGEEKMIKRFALFYAAGLLLSGVVLFVYMLPLLFHTLTLSLQNLAQPVNNPYFWDGAAYMLQISLMVALLLYSWIKNLPFLNKKKGCKPLG